MQKGAGTKQNQYIDFAYKMFEAQECQMRRFAEHPLRWSGLGIRTECRNDWFVNVLIHRHAQ